VHEWLGTVLVDLVPDGVRLARPVPTCQGAWACEGWSATRWVQGAEHIPSAASRWADVIQAGRLFHRAVAHLDRPDCLDVREDWWALGDRAAWQERTMLFRPEFVHLARRLEGALEPLGRPQIVHADLTRNVLFAPGLAPAVIDISPYWRPPSYAEGVVVADALCWHGAHPSLLQVVDVSVAAVARALLFRMATTNERVATGVGGVDLQDEAQRYRRAAAAIGV